MVAEFTASVAELPAPMRQDDFALAESARASLRRAVGRRLQKRPLVDVHLMRIAS
jgi:ribonuclease J